MKEKTDTKTSFNPEIVKAKSDSKKEDVKKDVAPAEVAKPKEKPISEMTDAEIEEYMKQRKAYKDSFTIVNEDIPMCKLVRASSVPAPQLNQQEVLRSVMYRQNKIERQINKK